uniref:Uncharacterized protein n=1 Tax=Lotharella oceanica TaxID=641309 RepID=A0A7S2U311_9EUKA|mmetsp:Transcript_7751/g.15153  ORF Transcript_7751/g.15153 Transcript_7751/m.15153 type:complete len:921 (+) Transcript_7751:821-3583(+)
MRTGTIERHIKGGSCSAFCTTYGIERKDAEKVYFEHKGKFSNVISFYVTKRRENDSQPGDRKVLDYNSKREATSPTNSPPHHRKMCQDTENSPGFHVYFISHEGTPLEEIKAMRLCLASAQSERSACRHKLLRVPRGSMEMAHPIIQIDASKAITEMDLRTLHMDVEKEFESIIRRENLPVQIRLLDNGVPSTSTLKMAKTYEDDPNVILYVVLTTTGKTIENMIMNWRSPPFPRTNLPPVLVITSKNNIAIVKRKLERIYDESLLDYQVYPTNVKTRDGFVVIQSAMAAYLNDQRQRKALGKEFSKVFTKGFVDCIPGDKSVFVYENCEGIMGKANTVSWIYSQRVLERLGGDRLSSSNVHNDNSMPNPNRNSSNNCISQKKEIVISGLSWLTRDFLHLLAVAVHSIHKCQLSMSARGLQVLSGTPCLRIEITSKDSEKLKEAYGFVHTLTAASQDIVISKSSRPRVFTKFKSKNVWLISGHLYNTGYICELMKILVDKKVCYECVDVIVGGTDEEKSSLTLNIFNASAKLQQEICESLYQLNDRYPLAQIRVQIDQDDPIPMEASPGKIFFLLEGHVFRSGVLKSIINLSDNSRILSLLPGRSFHDATKVVVESSIGSMQKVYTACTQKTMSSFGLNLRLISETEAENVKKQDTEEKLQGKRESYIEVVIGDMQGKHAKATAYAMWDDVNEITDCYGRSLNTSRPFQTRLRCNNQSQCAIELFGDVAKSYETKLSELRGIVEESVRKVNLGANDVQVALRYIPTTRITSVAPTIIEASKIKLFVVQTETGDTIRAIRQRCQKRDDVQFVMAIPSCDEQRAKRIVKAESGMQHITCTDAPRHPRMLVELALKENPRLSLPSSGWHGDYEIGIVYHSNAGPKSGFCCVQVMKCQDFRINISLSTRQQINRPLHNVASSSS